MRSKRAWFFAAAALLLLVLSVVVLFAWRSSAPTMIPQAMLRRTSFPVYQPAWLPEGFSVNQQSFDANEQVLTFAVKDASITRLVFTEQPKPSREQINSFYNQQLSAARTIPLKNGEATLGQFEGMPLAAIATDQTWVLIRAVAAIDDAQLQKIAENITPISAR